MDLLHRIRWTNVARAAALAAVVLLVVAWPRLRADPPPLPPQPRVVEEAAAAPAPGEELAFEAERPPPDVQKPEPRPRRRPREKRRRVVRREVKTAPLVVKAQEARPAAPAPVWRPPVARPQEFGFEGP